MPTGSSTSARAPATTAAVSCSRAHRPTSSPPVPPSPASTWRPTSAPDLAEIGRPPDGATGAEGHTHTMSENNKQTVRRMFDDIINGGNLELIDELFDEEFETTTGADTMNREQFKAF